MTPADGVECLICERVALAQRGENPTLIRQMASGYAVLGDDQFMRGYSLLLARRHVRELHDLEGEERERFLGDMAVLGEAVARATHSAKINYAMLGNTEQHLHCHVHPRYADEPEPYRRGPITAYPKELRADPRHHFDLGRDAPLIADIRQELESLDAGRVGATTGARFCIHCGRGLIQGADPDRLPTCPSCGWFLATRALPVALVLARAPSGAIVYTRQAGWPAGAWGLVAGYVEAGETAEAAGLRELREETGLVGRDARVLRTLTFGDLVQIVVDVAIDDLTPVAASDASAVSLCMPDLSLTPPGWPAYEVVADHLRRQRREPSPAGTRGGGSEMERT